MKDLSVRFGLGFARRYQLSMKPVDVRELVQRLGIVSGKILPWKQTAYC